MPQVSGANSESAHGDLFALSDEQILQIEPDAEAAHEPRPVGHEQVVPQGPAAAPAQGQDPATDSRAPTGDSEKAAEAAPNTTATSTEHGPRVTDHDQQPPKWLADLMADPHRGGEAKQFWAQAQQASVRARQLEELDRAYFAGDGQSPEEVAAARERLAETLLRQDPAAFREMVFAGLRALERANVAPPLRAASSELEPSATQAPAPVLASYAAFEKAANEELDRDVGRTIARVLEQALPNLNEADSGTVGAQHAAPLRTRLHAAIRQDIEAALRSDRQLGEQVALVIAGRRPGQAGTHALRFDDATRAQVVRLIGERARQLVPAAAKRVLGDWTQTALAAHRARAQKAETAAARPDVEGVGGAPADVRARAAGAREIDYRRMTDEQILDL